MHITLETDYAIRIVDCLARAKGRMGAQAIADATCVTLRFSLKILRKLVGAGIVRSYKGASGGYEIARPLEEISLGDIIGTIEGPYMLNRCLRDDHICNRQPQAQCPYHQLFATISDQVSKQLNSLTLDRIVQEGVPAELNA